MTLIPNVVRRHKTVLNIYFWDVLVEECSLTMTYVSSTPNVFAEPSEIVLRYIFTDYEYEKDIIITNMSEFPSYFNILQQEVIYLLLLY